MPLAAPRRLALSLPLLCVALASRAAPPSTDANPSAVSDPAPPAPLETVEVTANRLRNSRIDLSPRVGTTIYTIDAKAVDALAQGADASFDEVLLHLPGVDKDSKASGSLHVRDDHGNVQYRINGVQLPENISGFGTSIDTRFIDRVDFLTGTLPAQYGLRAAGVVEIETKEGKIAPGGEFSLGVGSHALVEPGAQLFGSLGSVTYYLSASVLRNDQGIENPLPSRTARHDGTRQTKTFGALTWYPDDSSRLGMIFGTYVGRFEIPVNPAQPAQYTLAGVSDGATGATRYGSSAVDERQHEQNRFVVGAYQQTLGDADFQVSAFQQYSELHFLPDRVGDLVFNGVASDVLRSNTAAGVQFDGSLKWNPRHTLRAGGGYTHQDTQSRNQVEVFDVDASGAQLPPFLPRALDDPSQQTGAIVSAYLQDEYHATGRLTVNYGLRYDRVDAFIQAEQWSPRINAAYRIDADTFLHAGYSRYFTPPPQELSAQRSIAMFQGTSNAAETAAADPVRAERSHYFDVGLGRTLGTSWTMAVDAYYKEITDLIDEGQFGQALILSPFNYAHGHVAGLEVSTTFTSPRWSAYANLACQRARASDIVSSQALFPSDRLAYIATHAVFLDHDQTWTASAGGSYRFDASQLSVDGLFGSGLRRTGADGVPNGEALPGYLVINAALSHSWKVGGTREIEGRIALLNAFDRIYLLRDGSGVGVGAPQYGARRTGYGSLALKF